MYKTKFTLKEEVADGTMRFHFVKPFGFDYEAGQSIDLTIGENLMHPFTLSSAPYEEDLYITTRMRDSTFKNTFKEMEHGGGLSFEGPFGDFTLHQNIKKDAVFLAGGIGITPFYSMIKNATYRKLPNKIILFYSNRRPEDTAFLSELQNLEKENTNFKLVGTMTDMEKSKEKWSGETGYIDETMIKKNISLDSNQLFYLAGPAVMVKGMRALLNSMHISNDDIRTEEFSGY